MSVRNLRSIRRGGVYAAMLGILGVGLLAQATPTCMPSSLLDSSATTSNTQPNVYSLGDSARELTTDELQALINNTATDGTTSIVFVSLLPGETGVKGDKGDTGDPGAQGPPGMDGTNGIDGKDGVSGLPLVGEVRMWAGPFAAVPSGWLACDGAEISRTDYAELFSVIGELYGVGNESTTFNLPNFQNRSPMGANGSGNFGEPTTDVSGTPVTFGGAATHMLTDQEMPAHDHSITHAHTLTGAANGSPGTTAIQLVDPSGATTPITVDLPSPDRTNIVGGGQPHNNLHPFFAVTYIIYVGQVLPSGT